MVSEMPSTQSHGPAAVAQSWVRRGQGQACFHLNRTRRTAGYTNTVTRQHNTSLCLFLSDCTLFAAIATHRPAQNSNG